MIWPIYILIGSVPLGVAGQNIAFFIALIGILLIVFRNNSSFFADTKRFFFHKRQRYFFAFLIVLTASTLMNADAPNDGVGRFVFGWLPLVLLPFLLSQFFQFSGRNFSLHKLYVFIALFSFLWGVICLSQIIWGWKLVDSQIVAEPVLRARGFYSHPLTMAYCAAVFFPSSVLLFIQKRNGLSALYFGGILLGLVCSQSRILQGLAVFLVLYNLYGQLSGKRRVVAIGLVFTVLSALAAFDNPIRSRFQNSFGEKADNFSGYPDDRLAFWHAHSLMFSEKPVLGHGVNLGTKYRTPYYESIGLADFPKKYEAHNTFFQITVNGGLVGLCFFLLWVFHQLRLREDGVFHGIYWQIYWQTWVFFLVGSLTQNSFQDSEVRFCFALFLAVMEVIRTAGVDVSSG